MKWHLLYTGANSGKYNMETDVLLSENLKSNEIILRFYQWNPYCISLGANQNINEMNYHKIINDGIEIVKRPTGGRAVLHSEELTYSIIFPLGFLTPREIYNQVNLALRKGLILHNHKLNCIELENENVNFRKVYNSNFSSACFSVSAKSELKFKGKKLVGSAQRKFRDAILQHGSILCGEFHKKIVDYLNVNIDEQEQVKNEIENKTISLSEIIEKEIDYKKLLTSLINGFEKSFNCDFSSSYENLSVYSDIVLV
jgi:lipoyl(octanoyl) transferase